MLIQMDPRWSNKARAPSRGKPLVTRGVHPGPLYIKTWAIAQRLVRRQLASQAHHKRKTRLLGGNKADPLMLRWRVWIEGLLLHCGSRPIDQRPPI